MSRNRTHLKNVNAPRKAQEAEKDLPKIPKRNRELTERQKAFAIAVVKLRAEGRENGTQACRDAGFKGNNNTLAKTASENLRHPKIRTYIQELTKEARSIPAVTHFRHIIGIRETLAITSFLATATLDNVLDDTGQFDIVKARRTGGIHALGRIKSKHITRRYKSGTVDHIVSHEIALRDKNFTLELMGKHLGLWTGEIDDPDEVLSRILEKYPKQLPPDTFESASNFGVADGDGVDNEERET